MVLRSIKKRDILKKLYLTKFVFLCFNQSRSKQPGQPASKQAQTSTCELTYLAYDMFKTAPNELVNAKVCNRLLIAYLQGKIISLHFDIF